MIDTPGILDHPLEDRNTIEMQSITALAHLRACVLYFLDISEQCGYPIAAQVALFHNIKPLFTNKPLILVVNKIDVIKLKDLPEESQQAIATIVKEGATMVESSSFSDEGIMNVKTVACEKLLAARVEQKLRGKKIDDVLNKLHLAQPLPRDSKVGIERGRGAGRLGRGEGWGRAWGRVWGRGGARARARSFFRGARCMQLTDSMYAPTRAQPRPAAIPEAVASLTQYDRNDPNRPRLERDLEEEAGGAGQFSVDLQSTFGSLQAAMAQGGRAASTVK